MDWSQVPINTSLIVKYVMEHNKKVMFPQYQLVLSPLTKDNVPIKRCTKT